MTYEWLAGFFDGEGCVSIGKCRKVTYTLHVSIGQKKIGVLKDIVEFLGYGKISHCEKGKCPLLYFFNNEAANLLKNLLPYLKVKYLQAKMAIHFQENKEPGNRRHHISEEQLKWRESCKQFISSHNHSAI